MGTEVMICFSGLRRTLYRPGSRFNSWAAWSKRSIIASNGFSSARKVSLSGRIRGCAGDLIAGSLISLVWTRGSGTGGRAEHGVQRLLQRPAVPFPADGEHRDQRLG